MNTRPLLVSLCATFGIASTAAAQTQQRYYPQPQGGYPQPQYSQPAPPNYQQPYQQAPQGYGYPQQQPTQYENPIQFLPKFGKRMSEMVRRIFYGQDPTGYDNPPQGYGSNGYSLDSSPRQSQVPNYPQQQPMPGAGYQYPQQQQVQPGYNYPPQQQPVNPSRTQSPVVPQNKSTTHAPATPSKSATSNSKYSPPKVNDSPAKAPTKSPATTRTPKPEPDTPPPTTTRRSETTPKEQPTASSSSSGSFLKGKKTAKPGRVISPYPPYKELDITGLESGSLALDPTTQKVFEVP